MATNTLEIAPLEDMNHDEPALCSDDIFIAVMGITGSGKSSFVNLLVADDVAVGHTLEPCTAKIETYAYRDKHGRRIYLVDTPGFDDSRMTDTEVLQVIAYYFATLYRQNIRLTGMVYMHRITDNRIGGAPLQSLRVFKALCGEHACPHIVLATTMWSKLDDLTKGNAHVRQLIDCENWWGSMQRCGSQIMKHTHNADSANAIVQTLIGSRDLQLVLSIQSELVDKRLSLENTQAGREVDRHLHAALQNIRTELAEQHQAVLEERDAELKKILQQHQDTLQQTIEQMSKERTALRIGLERLAEERQRQYQDVLQQLLTEREEHDARMAAHKIEYAQLQDQIHQDADENKKFDQEIRVGEFNEKVKKEKRHRSKTNMAIQIVQVLAGIGSFVADIMTIAS